MIQFSKKCVQFCWSVRRELVRYVMVGIGSFVIDYGLFFVLHSLMNVWYLGATAISQTIALLFNFFSNRHWSFKKTGATHKQLFRYCLLQAWNYAFAIIALYALVTFGDVSPLISKLIIIPIISSWNFLLYKYFVYI